MYVCLCLGFTDRKVREAIADGCRTASAVYRRCGGGAPRCGRCAPYVRDMLSAAEPAACEALESAALADAPAEAA